MAASLSRVVDELRIAAPRASTLVAVASRGLPCLSCSSGSGSVPSIRTRSRALPACGATSWTSSSSVRSHAEPPLSRRGSVRGGSVRERTVSFEDAGCHRPSSCVAMPWMSLARRRTAL